MAPRWRLGSVVLAVACILLVAAKVTRPRTAPAGPTPDPSILVVYAAASLTESFADLGQSFAAANPGSRVVFNFAGSQQLRTQIEQGAQADVFASADARNMEAAQAAGLIQGSARTFARNRLVVIVPKDNPAGIKDVKSLAAPGVKLVIADAAVPVGNYTLQALARLAADSAYGPDFRTKTLARVVSTENSVRQVVSKVALGEADAGVVYATDARTDAARLLVIAIPDQYNVVVTYPAAVVQGSKNPALAQAFIDMLLSAGGQATMSAYGFAAP